MTFWRAGGKPQALRQLPADDRVVDAQEVSLGLEEVGPRGLDVLEHLAERLGHERSQGDVADVVDEGGQKGLVGRNCAEACGDDLGRHARRQVVTPQTHEPGAAKDLGVQDADAQQVGEDFLEADGLKSGLDGCQIPARVARPRSEVSPKADPRREAEDACGQGGVGLDGLLNLAVLGLSDTSSARRCRATPGRVGRRSTVSRRSSTFLRWSREPAITAPQSGLHVQQFGDLGDQVVDAERLV